MTQHKQDNKNKEIDISDISSTCVVDPVLLIPRDSGYLVCISYITEISFEAEELALKQAQAFHGQYKKNYVCDSVRMIDFWFKSKSNAQRFKKFIFNSSKEKSNLLYQWQVELYPNISNENIDKLTINSFYGLLSDTELL